MKTTASITIIELLKNYSPSGELDKTFDIDIRDSQVEGNPLLYGYVYGNVLNNLITRYGDWSYIYLDLQTKYTSYNDPLNDFILLWLNYKYDNMLNWERIAHAYNLQYNPIHNYDRNETETIGRTNNGDNTTSFNDYKIKQDIPPKSVTKHTFGDDSGGNLPTSTQSKTTYDSSDFVNDIQSVSK